MLSSRALPTCWAGSHSPGQGNPFFQQYTGLCQIMPRPRQHPNRKHYHQPKMRFLWNRAIYKLLCISRWFCESYNGLYDGGGVPILPATKDIVPSCQALSPKTRSSHWNLLPLSKSTKIWHFWPGILLRLKLWLPRRRNVYVYLPVHLPKFSINN